MDKRLRVDRVKPDMGIEFVMAVIVMIVMAVLVMLVLAMVVMVMVVVTVASCLSLPWSSW